MGVAQIELSGQPQPHIWSNSWLLVALSLAFAGLAIAVVFFVAAMFAREPCPSEDDDQVAGEANDARQEPAPEPKPAKEPAPFPAGSAGPARAESGPRRLPGAGATRAALGVAVLALAGIAAALINNAVSGSARTASPAPGPPAQSHAGEFSASPAPGGTSLAWQCGRAVPATLWKTSGDIGQTLQACIRADHGHLDLEGVLTGSVNAWKEQIVLNLRDSRQESRGKFYSPVCTNSLCIYTVAVQPGRGKWTVFPQWERQDGDYQSTGPESPFITY
jgi:hypothetical protein